MVHLIIACQNALAKKYKILFLNFLFKPLKLIVLGAGEVAQQLGALATLPEDLGLVPSTYLEWLKFQRPDALL